MSDFSKVTQSDEDRFCEHCKTPVLKAPVSRFGILQNCDDVFCYICAHSFWKEVKHSENESQFYLECPVCHVKSYSIAASSRWIEKREEKMVYFDKFFEDIKDLPCEFCHKEKGSCMHGKKYTLNLDIDETKSLSLLKFDNSSCQLYPPHVLLGSDLWSKINELIPFNKPLTEENETTFEACSSEASMFTEKYFPILRDSVTMGSKTELSEDKKAVVDSSTGISYTNILAENLTEKEPDSLPNLSTPTLDLPPEYNKPLPPEFSLENDSRLPFLPEEMLPEYPIAILTNYQKRIAEVELNKYVSELFRANPRNDFHLSDNIPSNNLRVNFSNDLQSSKVVNNRCNSEFKAENGDKAPNSCNSQTPSSPSSHSSRIDPLTESNAKPTPSFEDHARKNSEHFQPQRSIFIHDLNMNDSSLQGCYNAQIRNNLNEVHRLKTFQDLTGNINPRSEKICDHNTSSGSNHSIWQDNLSNHKDLAQPGFEIVPMNSGFSLQNDSTRSNWTFNQYPITPERDSSNLEIPFQQEKKKHKQIISENYVQQEPMIHAHKQTNHERKREINFRNSHTNLNYQMEFSYRYFTNYNFHNTNQANLNENLNQFHQFRLQSLAEIPADLKNHLQIVPYNQFPRDIFKQTRRGLDLRMERNYFFHIQNFYRKTWWSNVHRQVQMTYLFDQINLFYLIHPNVRGSSEAIICSPNPNQVVYQRSNSAESSERQTSCSDDVSDENIDKAVEKRS